MKKSLFRMLALGLIVGAAIPFFGSCNNSDIPPDTMPYVMVNEQVYLNTTEGIALNQRDGAWIYHEGGLDGLIVYRKAANQFQAFERRNPNANACHVNMDATGFFMLDSCTNSQHYFDGTIRGVDVRPLRQYAVNNDGIRIIITN